MSFLIQLKLNLFSDLVFIHSGAILSPPPLALVMGYPLLEINKVLTDSPGYFVPASTPGHLRPLLNPDHVGKVEMAKTSVPDMPMALDKSPYAADMRARFGMDIREPWKGKEESTCTRITWPSSVSPFISNRGRSPNCTVSLR